MKSEITKKRKELFVVFDELDGTFVFPTKNKAERTLEEWKKESKNDPFDTVWNMKIYRYVLDES